MLVPVAVSEGELNDLDDAIRAACLLKSHDRLEANTAVPPSADYVDLPGYFYTQGGELSISFDGGWYPFLDEISGYNQRHQRWYIPKRSVLLARIARAMQEPLQARYSQIPGGRVFLTATGVTRRPEGYPEVEVLRWKLPRDSAFILPSEPQA